jgi:deoxyribodipyrimidine photolyase-related protein
MDNNCFIVLPNQLFDNIEYYIRDITNTIFIIEEPHFFSEHIKPNKIKIAYLRSCMKLYYDNLKKKLQNYNIVYIDFSNIIKNKYNFLKKYKLFSFELNDYKLKNKYNQLNLFFNELNSPMFIMNKHDLDLYNRNNPSHSSFYIFVKNKLQILQNIKNQDIYNRKNKRQLINLNISLNTNYTAYYIEAIEYSNRPIFKEHIGNATLDTLRIYPINSIDSYRHFEQFLINKCKYFGDFQDVIQDNNPFLYHSIISPMLNIGLIEPLKIIQIIIKYENKLPLNAYEGFIRQIIGWREYMKYLYQYKYDLLIKSNNFNNSNNLDKSWYNATTGIIILDNEIKKVITYGYAHHIVRLMVFLNFMILNQINPNEIYKWFMEVISIDAYDWVMIPNIYSMGYFSNIGMKRPYLSSSNYLLKMSNYKKDNKWDIIWTNKFRNFVKLKNIKFYLRSIKN